MVHRLVEIVLKMLEIEVGMIVEVVTGLLSSGENMVSVMLYLGHPR